MTYTREHEDGSLGPYEEETCPEGYTIEDCCNCITRFGIEHCEWSCPFGGPPVHGEKQAEKCREHRRNEQEKRIKRHEERKKQRNYQIDETKQLEISTQYPFRPAFTDTAICGMCKSAKRQLGVAIACKEGLSLKYPLLVKQHHCEQYEYEPHYIIKIPEDKIHLFVGIGVQERRKECNQCAHFFHGYCDGIKWFPFDIKDGKCEFFRNKNLLCKHAIPHFQYGGTTRNNYCKLHPSKRDGDQAQSWLMRCPYAHKEHVEKYLDCYTPKTNIEAKGEPIS